MTAFLRRHLPSSVSRALRRAYYWPADVLARFRRDRPEDELSPPRSLKLLFGGGDFQATGQLHLSFFVELAGLRSVDHVLEVGCGSGRMAVPLTSFLSDAGGYSGFDIVPAGVQWCQEHIAGRFPHFHFDLADIRNQTYNPKGRILAGQYRFPHVDGQFDFQFSTSVFTHMRWQELEHYVNEIARVLKPGGRSLNTFFLLNDESLRLLEHGRSTQDLRYAVEGGRCVSRREPEKAIGQFETLVRTLYSECGLEITQPVHYGSWCGRNRFVSYQDMIVAVKRAARA